MMNELSSVMKLSTVAYIRPVITDEIQNIYRENGSI